jgi:hypothetical protein
MKVGLTLLAKEKLVEYWNNGIQQNVLFLAEALHLAGLEAHLLVHDRALLNSKRKEELGIPRGVKVTSWGNIHSAGFDVVIQMGLTLELPDLKRLRDAGVTLISYKCGNDFFVTSETILYRMGQNPILQPVELHAAGEAGIFTEIWSIPQMINPCSKYWTTLYRSPVVEAPFVWSPSLLRKVGSETGRAYTKRDKHTRLAIMEPNISFMKYFLPALLVCENAHRLGTEISRVYLTNIDNEIAKHPVNIEHINHVVKCLDLHAKRALSVESRYNALYFINKHADAVVSWQVENNLNYLYLDLAWTGWPIIHNGNLCPDVGYYYEGFDYEEGGRVLKAALEGHGADGEYLERNRAVIDRYLPTNGALQARYVEMLEAVRRRT